MFASTPIPPIRVAEQLNAAGIATEISSRLRQAIDTEWAWATYPMPWCTRAEVREVSNQAQNIYDDIRHRRHLIHAHAEAITPPSPSAVTPGGRTPRCLPAARCHGDRTGARGHRHDGLDARDVATGVHARHRRCRRAGPLRHAALPPCRRTLHHPHTHRAPTMAGLTNCQLCGSDTSSGQVTALIIDLRPCPVLTPLSSPWPRTDVMMACRAAVPVLLVPALAGRVTAEVARVVMEDLIGVTATAAGRRRLPP